MRPGTIVYRGKSKTGLPIVVRYPMIRDVKVMRRYINTLSRERTYIGFQGGQMSFKAERKYVEEITARIKDNSAVVLLVFSGNMLIGSSDVVCIKAEAMQHMGHFGIVIAKKFRGQGIGTLLMKLVLKETKRNLKRIKIVTLGVFANNPRAIHLYKKFGFKHYGTIPKGLFRRGKYVDDLYMYRRI